MKNLTKAQENALFGPEDHEAPIAKGKHSPGHELKIKSLHDTMATCECDEWYYCSTGFSTREKVQMEHEKHIRRVLNHYNRGLRETIEVCNGTTLTARKARPIGKPQTDANRVLSVSPCSSCTKSALGQGWKWGRCTTPSEDDARLIAAAPELLRALRSVVALLELVASDGGKRSIAAIDAINYANEAINKAVKE